MQPRAVRRTRAQPVQLGLVALLLFARAELAGDLQRARGAITAIQRDPGAGLGEMEAVVMPVQAHCALQVRQRAAGVSRSLALQAEHEVMEGIALQLMAQPFLRVAREAAAAAARIQLG